MESFAPLSGQIKEILGTSNFVLLENVRQNPGEEANDLEFAKKLAEPFDIYVNDAFAVCHRNHASVSAITKFLPSYGGLLLMKEIKNLTEAIKAPREGKTLILGGAKISTKLPVINNFLNLADRILIGGAVANVFLREKGIDVGESLINGGSAKTLPELDEKILIPRDYIRENGAILDIGSKTAAEFSGIIGKSKMIVWNGPMGQVEIERFSRGTAAVAEAAANSKAFSIVGGGDTVAFLEKIGLLGKMSYVSTGGGAMLQFLAGYELPGLKALE